jgi:hypothetical protein
MATPEEHYQEAERLLDEGIKVVQRIADVINEPYPEHVLEIGEDEYTREWQVQRRDELGKKAMGIWAQAQVHATLAITPFEYPAAGFR